jgi:hypothetical protein
MYVLWVVQSLTLSLISDLKLLLSLLESLLWKQ